MFDSVFLEMFSIIFSRLYFKYFEFISHLATIYFFPYFFRFFLTVGTMVCLPISSRAANLSFNSLSLRLASCRKEENSVKYT